MSSNGDSNTEEVTVSPPKTESKPTKEIATDYAREGRDAESFGDVKEAEVLDPFGHEDGAEVKCKPPSSMARRIVFSS